MLVADVTSPSVTRIPLEVSTRGAYERIRIDVGSDAPFGIALSVRRRTLDLPRRLLVGPATLVAAANVAELVGSQSDSLPRGVSMSGESVRAVRPYVTGDPSHLVHWPTTARVGQLVVRELEPPVATGLAIVVDLTPPFDAADPTAAVEAAASRAAGVAEDALAKGARVVMCTVEVSGPVVDEVADLLAVRRRLALAVEGSPPAAPDGWPSQRVGVDS